MDPLARRKILAFGAAGGAAVAAAAANAAVFGNPDQPSQGAANANAGSVSDPGPQNPALSGQFPSFNSPPSTDVGGMPLGWASFNNAPKRIQNGGWARGVTQADFAISEAVSGVNMRLSAGGIRELHWHLAAEWAYVTNGRCRITVLDTAGQGWVEDVGVGDLWYFPPGFPHSLQGLGPDGCEFLIVFDNGRQSEYNTLLVSDWFAHTPPDVLALNFGVPAETFKSIPLQDLWIFQGKEPGPLAADQAAIGANGAVRSPFTFSLDGSQPIHNTRSGTLRLADSSTFKISKTIAAAVQTIRPGGMREMHWHPNADEWQYYIKGQARMTVFEAGPAAQTMDFRAGDIGYVRQSRGHFVQNTGTTDLQFLAVFKAAEYQDVNLSNWLAHTPPDLVAQHLNMSVGDLRQLPTRSVGIVPG